MSLTLEQQRISAAYQLVEKVPKDQKGEWKTMALGFGAEVQRCGLLQTLIFLKRRDKLAEQLSEAIRTHVVARKLIEANRATEPLISLLTAMDADRYMLVTREVLALSLWIKRATQAL